ncbi:unnamed protein product [Caenorhabditis auriculariae]|uniref:Uncharacterized protein n=1 Tax=Caenorhabditis auriculariae TaxID=2777116 RepID=A0A8S1HVV9_9PELO|nr:unnamed protein product [Caenorhabditis auriculariae]
MENDRYSEGSDKPKSLTRQSTRNLAAISISGPSDTDREGQVAVAEGRSPEDFNQKTFQSEHARWLQTIGLDLLMEVSTLSARSRALSPPIASHLSASA